MMESLNQVAINMITSTKRWILLILFMMNRFNLNGVIPKDKTVLYPNFCLKMICTDLR